MFEGKRRVMARKGQVAFFWNGLPQYAASELDARNQAVAETRAWARAKTASFQICDVRQFDEKEDLKGRFDVVVCTENIGHIIDDFCLRCHGRLPEAWRVSSVTSPQLDRIPQPWITVYFRVSRMAALSAGLQQGNA
jgi:hypothetical protein